MEEPRSRGGKATRIRKTKTTGKEREKEKGNSEFIDQRCRLVVSEHENATERKNEIMGISLSLSLSLSYFSWFIIYACKYETRGLSSSWSSLSSGRWFSPLETVESRSGVARRNAPWRLSLARRYRDWFSFIARYPYTSGTDKCVARATSIIFFSPWLT